MAWKAKATAAAAGLVVLGAGLTVARGPQAGPDGYLGEAAAPDTVRILPPPPPAGSARDAADRAVFRQTRALKDTPRWALAVTDVDQAHMLAHEACALGVELTGRNAPRTLAMFERLGPDIGRAVNRPKDFYGRRRPYLVDTGPTCQPPSADLARSPDYPSGHATFGWTYGLILAELAPDRATPILVRARAFGESRVVCGVHTASAVEAGLADASVLVAALHGQSAFRQDLDAARREVADARRQGPGPNPAACAAEAAQAGPSPY
ncbi:phosphatase PAP2 family protein [Phenylobacterium sp.]|jgi:acid phosphatase (class A)|uniref:acid phosphatase n=1 Tax=Phenylobacterium sp. TaxID=1871053 RepID=UPI002F42414B